MYLRNSICPNINCQPHGPLSFSFAQSQHATVPFALDENAMTALARPRVHASLPASASKQPSLSLRLHLIPAECRMFTWTEFGLNLDLQNRTVVGYGATLEECWIFNWLGFVRGSWQPQTSDWKLCVSTASSRGCLQPQTTDLWPPETTTHVLQKENRKSKSWPNLTITSSSRIKTQSL